MSIFRLLFVCLHIVSQTLASCPYIRTSVILAECVFDTSLYISLGARILNPHSIDFVGHYSFDNNGNLARNTLVYNLGHRWMLLVPFLLKCANQPVNLTFTECQYTIQQIKQQQGNRISSSPEYMTTQLSIANVTELGRQSVLFLQPGEISLRSCKAYDCSQQLVYLTASNETFDLTIRYEKSVGATCQSDEECSNVWSATNLVRCDSKTQTCQCFDEHIATIDVPGVGRLCTDSIDRSNCTKFPRRCLKWCDGSKTSHCLCPISTRKVRKTNGQFDCELEPTGKCRFDDEKDQQIGAKIRKCPTGTFCDGNRCRPPTVSRQFVENFSTESLLSSTTTLPLNFFSPTFHFQTSKQNDRQFSSTLFFRTLIIIGIAIVLLFILIVLIIAILVKSNRFPASSSSSSDKVSSSSFAPSTSTAMSNDSTTGIHYHHQLKSSPPIIAPVDFTRRYDNYFVQGLLPQSNLSPRFHRQHQPIDDRRRRPPLHIRSPSLSRINPFADHALLTTTNEQTTKRRAPLPIVTRLQNGDVLISA